MTLNEELNKALAKGEYGEADELADKIARKQCEEHFGTYKQTHSKQELNQIAFVKESNNYSTNPFKDPEGKAKLLKKYFQKFRKTQILDPNNPGKTGRIFKNVQETYRKKHKL